MRRLTRRQRVAAVTLVVLALGFITLDVGGSGLSSAHGGVRGALGSLYRGTDTVLGPVRRFVQGVPHAASNEQQVSDLTHQNSLLRKELADARVDRATARSLTKLRLAEASGGYQVVPARVAALSAGQGFDWTVTLGIGATSGVRAGQTVTDGYGLVGRVLRADRSSSVVLLAVDPGSGVGVRDRSSGQLGVATGGGVDGYTFVPLDPHATARVGDQLVTGPSGRSRFVAGLALGTVRTVHTAPDGTTRASVTPQTSPTALDLVGVIVQAPNATRMAGGR